MRIGLLTVCFLLGILQSQAQVITTISASTKVIGSGTKINIPTGSLINNGTINDSLFPGALNLTGGVTFSGNGSTIVYDLNLIASGTNDMSALEVSVTHTAMLASGVSLNAGSGKLNLRTDLPAYLTVANLVNNGLLTGTVGGLQTYATATSGPCSGYNSTLSTNVSGTSMDYQWESSPDNIVWTPVSGATNATYTLTVSATNYYHCLLTTSNTAFTQATPGVLLSISSPPASISGPSNLCVGANITLTNSVSGGTWSSSNGNATVGNTSGIVTGVTAGTSIITYSNGCAPDATLTITVNAIPQLTVTPTAQTVCNGNNTTSLVFTSNVTGTTYAWSNDNVSIGQLASGTGGTIPSFTATNTGTTATTGTITVTPTANSCVGAQQTSTITVNPTPTLTVTPTAQTVCNNANTTAEVFSSNVAGTTYTWNNSNPGIGILASGTGSTIPSFTATNTGTTAISGTITITPTAGSCPGSQQTAIITVNPTPILTVTPTAQTVCNGSNTTAEVFLSTVAGTTYTWNNSNTTIGILSSGSGSTIPSFTATNTGTTPISATITVTPTAGSCPGAQQTAIITVNPTPTLTVTPTAQTVCNNANTTAEVFLSTVAGTTYTWNNSNPAIGILASGTGSTIPSFTATNTGTAPISGTITVSPTAGSCPGLQQTAIITVNPTPSMSVTPTAQSVCNGSNTTAEVFLSTVIGTTFTWTNNNVAIGIGGTGTGPTLASFTATNPGSTPSIGSFTVTPTANSCPGAQQSFSITVNPTPHVVFINPGSIFACNNTATPPEIFSSSVVGTSYTWTNIFSNIGNGLSGSGSSIPSFTAINTGTSSIAGTFSVIPTANGCTGPSNAFSIIVVPSPTASISGTTTVTQFDPFPNISFTGAVGPAPYTFTYNINGGSPITVVTTSGNSVTVPVTTGTPGTFTYNLISVQASASGSAPSCSNSQTGSATVTINPAVNATATPTSQNSCSGASITPVVINGSVPGTTFNWTRDNNSSVTGIPASGTGNISGILNNTTSSPVTVTFTITPTYNGFSGVPATSTVMVYPPVTVTTVASPQFPMAGQEIQTVYLNYPASAQADTIIATASNGLPTYHFSWSKSGCNVITPGTYTNATNTAVFSPTISDVCSGNNDNVYVYTVMVTDGRGCTGSNFKRVNVVNPYVGTDVQVCHKVAVRGASSTQLLVVSASQVGTHLSHGDGLGNCPPFTGKVVTTEDPEEVMVYPNPTTGVFIVELSRIAEQADITVTDVQGKLITHSVLIKGQAPTATISLNNFAAGMYLIQVKDGELNYRAKIVLR